MIFFILRGVFFLLLISLPLSHPAILVAYDRFWGLSLFAMVPLGMAAGVAFPLKKINIGVQGSVLAVVPLIINIAVLGLPWSFGGFQGAPILSAGVFYLSFTLTWFLYYRKSLWAGIFEPFFLALLSIRLLEYFQGGLELKELDAFLPSFYFFLIVFLFLGQSLVITLWIGRDKEGFRFTDTTAVSATVILILVVSFFAVQPNSFIHQIVENSAYDKAEPRPQSMEEAQEFEDEGAPGDMEAAEGEADLFTMDGEDFSNNMTEQDKQYAVMLVHSNRPSLYLSGEYFGNFDQELGFTLSEEERLNEYRTRRFLEVYEAPRLREQYRQAVNYSVYSLFGEKYIPYFPSEIEPTVYRGEYSPFGYIHKGESQVSYLGPADFELIRELSDEESIMMRDYLRVDLMPEDRQVFENHLQEILPGSYPLGERLIRVLRGFSTFQYQLGFDEDVSLRKLTRFVSNTRTGDCTEFSNTLALLARMVGVPSRVVTGWVASPGLQTLAHRQATYQLQQSIPALQDIPMEELILVSTAHRHSWTQVWLPEAGWVDFESTSTALPPDPSLDPNNMDLVIPQIQPELEQRDSFVIPWGLLLNLTLLGLGAGFAGLYLFVIVKYLSLYWTSRGQGQKAAIALYRLLLFRLAKDGYPVKDPHETAEDYALRVGGMEDFARKYNRIRYRSSVESEAVEDLRVSYQQTMNTNKVPGFKAAIYRFFRIKGLGL